MKFLVQFCRKINNRVGRKFSSAVPLVRSGRQMQRTGTDFFTRPLAIVVLVVK